MRSRRPIRCSTRVKFQGMSKFTITSQVCRFSPSDIESVPMRIWMSPERNRDLMCSFLTPLQRPSSSSHISPLPP